MSHLNIELTSQPILDWVDATGASRGEHNRMLLMVNDKPIGCWWPDLTHGYRALIFSTEQEIGPFGTEEDFIRAIEGVLASKP